MVAIPGVSSFLTRLAPLFLFVWTATAAFAQEAPVPAPGEEDSTPRQSYAETPRLREARPGEWRETESLSWTPRFISIVDTSGFRDSFTRPFFFGLHMASLRYERLYEYHLAPDLELVLRPTLSLSYNYHEFSSHEEFRLQSLGVNRELPAHFKVHQIAMDAGFQAGLRWDRFEPFLDYRSLYGLRFQRVESSPRQVTSPGGGFLDNVEAPVRKETARFIMHDWGVGLGWNLGDEPWNLRLAAIARPATAVTYLDRSATLSGFGLDLRTNGLRLSDDVDIALSFRWDYWFARENFSRTSIFEFGLGVRFG